MSIVCDNIYNQILLGFYNLMQSVDELHYHYLSSKNNDTKINTFSRDLSYSPIINVFYRGMRTVRITDRLFVPTTYERLVIDIDIDNQYDLVEIIIPNDILPYKIDGLDNRIKNTFMDPNTGKRMCLIVLDPAKDYEIFSLMCLWIGEHYKEINPSYNFINKEFETHYVGNFDPYKFKILYHSYLYNLKFFANNLYIKNEYRELEKDYGGFIHKLRYFEEGDTMAQDVVIHVPSYLWHDIKEIPFIGAKAKHQYESDNIYRIIVKKEDIDVMNEIRKIFEVHIKEQYSLGNLKYIQPVITI